MEWIKSGGEDFPVWKYILEFSHLKEAKEVLERLLFKEEEAEDKAELEKLDQPASPLRTAATSQEQVPTKETIKDDIPEAGSFLLKDKDVSS